MTSDSIHLNTPKPFVPSLRQLFFSKPLVGAALGMVAGLVLGRSLAWPIEDKGLWLWAGATVLLVSAASLGQGFRKISLAFILFTLAGFTAGLYRIQPFNNALVNEAAVPAEAVWIEARVLENLGAKEETGRHGFLLDRARYISLQDPEAQALSWEGKLRMSYDYGFDSKRVLHAGPGDRIGFYGNFWAASAPTNPGEFDFKTFQIGRGITAGASARGKQTPQWMSYEGGLPLRRLAWRAQHRLGLAFDRHLSPRLAALAKGSILGDKSGLERRDQKAYTRSGLAYLLAVSGLHLGLALLFFVAIAKRISSKRRVQAVLALTAVMAYALVTGLQVPAQRAACLFVLVLIAKILDFETDFGVSLAFGALLVLWVQPGALWEAGFQLSFLVTTSIVYIGQPLGKRLERWLPKWLAAFLGVVWSAQLGVIPLSAWHFHQFTWPALVSDGSVAWTMPLIIALGLVYGLVDLIHPGVSWLLSWPLAACLWWLDKANAFFAHLPGAVLSVGPSSWALASAWLVMALWLAHRLPIKKILIYQYSDKKNIATFFCGLLLMLWTLWPGLPWAHQHPGKTLAWFLDVGQGDSILVEFEDGKTLLVDAGTAKPDSGSWVIEPALRYLGISRIDSIALSHPHADHIGGVSWLVDQVDVGTVYYAGWTYASWSWKNLVKELNQKNISLIALSQTQQVVDWDNKVKVIAPLPKLLKGTEHDLHNNGLAIQVGNFLTLTGDMGIEGEAALIASGKLSPTAVFKAGHHGSRTSSSVEFMKVIEAQLGVIQTGRRYIYGHPHEQSLGRMKKALKKIWRTDLNGCVAMIQYQDKTEVQPWMFAEEGKLWEKGRRPPKIVWKKIIASGALEKAKKKMVQTYSISSSRSSLPSSFKAARALEAPYLAL